MPQPSPSKDTALVAAGFEQCSGELRAPAGTAVSLTPIGRFYQLAIKLPDGDVVSVIVSERALNIDRRGVKL